MSVNVNQQLSLIPLGQLNAALVQTGYGSEVSSNKADVVTLLSRIVDNGGIDVDSIRKLVPLSTAAINAKQASKPAASSGNTFAVQSAIEAIDDTKRQVSDIAKTAREFIDQAQQERNAIISQFKSLGDEVVERLNNEVSKVQGINYDIVNEAAREEVNKLFESFRTTASVEQLQVVANAVPRFELRLARDVFPAPLYYQHDGDTVDFSDLPVGVWDDADAPALVDDYIFNPKHLHQALVALNDPLPDNVWLAGERGTGKTEFVNQIASRLGRKLYRINFDEAMERAEFIGGNTIKNGDVEWKAGIITQAIQHTGALILLDEIGFARAQNLAALHALCERSAHRSIVIAETGVRIPVASHVAFFCADNSNGHGDSSGNFAGVRDQNSAFIDRFSYTLNFEYLPFADEVDLVVNRTSLNRDAAEVLIGFANVAREKARAGVLTQPPSLRQLFAWARAVHKGLPVAVAFDNAIVNKFPADCESELRGVFTATVDVTQLKKYLTK